MTYTKLISDGKLLTSSEVAELLGVGLKSVNSYVYTGVMKYGKRRIEGNVRVKLAAVRLPGGLRFEPAAVDAFLAALNGSEPPEEDMNQVV